MWHEHTRSRFLDLRFGLFLFSVLLDIDIEIEIHKKLGDNQQRLRKCWQFRSGFQKSKCAETIRSAHPGLASGRRSSRRKDVLPYRSARWTASVQIRISSLRDASPTRPASQRSVNSEIRSWICEIFSSRPIRDASMF